MLISHAPSICEFLEREGAGWFHPETVNAFGYVSKGEIVAGVAFYNFRGTNAWFSFAAKGGRFPKTLLQLCGEFAFQDLKLKRLTFEIAETNLRSIQFATGLGAKLEATLPDGCAEGALLLFSLRPEHCPLWRKHYVKRQPSETALPR